MLGPKLKNAMLPSLGKPIRTVLRWQLVATAVLTLAAGLIAGVDGALSAALGGLVSVVPADIVSDFNLYASAFGPQYDDNLYPPARSSVKSSINFLPKMPERNSR